jgi:hypothetical protein
VECFIHGTFATKGKLAPSGGGGGGPKVPIASKTGRDPRIVSDGAGGAIIVWEDNRNFPGSSPDIYAQRISAEGVALWAANGIPISTAANFQQFPQIISDGAGGAIIAWVDHRAVEGSNVFPDIFAQRINSAGVVQWAANGIPIATTNDDEGRMRLAPDGTGGAIIVWERGQGGSGPRIYAQRVNGAGLVQWTVDGVALTPFIGLDQLKFPQIVSDGAGGVIIAWYHSFPNAGFQIYAQRVSSAGAVLWAANGVLLTDYPVDIGGHWTGQGARPKLIGDGAGGAIISWDGFDDVGHSGIFAQRINSSGVVQWAPKGVVLAMQNPVTGPSNEEFPNDPPTSVEIISDGVNGAIITWSDLRNGANVDVYAQRVTGTGVVQWTTDGVAIGTGIGSQDSPKLIADNAGGAIIVWQDKRKVSEYDIYAQRVNNAGVPQWTANGLPISTAAATQRLPVITADGAGGAFIAWQDEPFGPFGDIDIYAQRVTAAGVLP